MEVRILPGAFGHLVRISGKLPLPPNYIGFFPDLLLWRNRQTRLTQNQVVATPYRFKSDQEQFRTFVKWLRHSPFTAGSWVRIPQVRRTGRSPIQGRGICQSFDLSPDEPPCRGGSFFVQSARAVCPILFEFCPITSMNPYKMRLLLSN